MPGQFAPEFRQRALRMLEESLPEHETEYSAIRHVSTKLGVGPEMLRKWRRRAESGARPGVSSEELAAIKRLKRENAELRRADEILRTASVFFAAEPGRLRRDDPIRGHVQGSLRRSCAICRILRATECGFLTARGYRAAESRPPSARVLSDLLLGAEVRRLHVENYGVYGVRKMHALMRRQGWIIGRDQTGRTMQSLGLRGVKRSKRVFTTTFDPTGVKPLDLVQRKFTAAAPRKLWVVDVTYVRTWQGFAYVAFVTDVFSRRIVGFNVASTLKADILPLQALDMAAFTAGSDLTGLTYHCDQGSNYMSLADTDRIIELGATPSTGTVGISYDCQSVRVGSVMVSEVLAVMA